MSTAPQGLLNIFEPGLIRGAARLAYQPHKRYFYVEHPVEGWRVYLRACCMIHPDWEQFRPDTFLVVHRYGATPNTKSWEPPKGQMEAKDAKPDGAPLIELMAENVRREVFEEAKIEQIHNLRYTGLVIQSREKDYPANHYFQYHIFSATVSAGIVQQAEQSFQWLHDHPAAWERMRADRREKDGIAWFNPHATRLMGKWSPSIVALYLQSATAPYS
jgi:8-oxo-dGTP pyrophosphatase MutT (NUDIX family)